MARILTGEGFVTYAREQVAAADAIIGRHRYAGVSCACGRPLPCPQLQSLLERRSYFTRRLAIMEPAADVPTAPRRCA
jgi:hypothetical protein